MKICPHCECSTSTNTLTHFSHVRKCKKLKDNNNYFGQNGQRYSVILADPAWRYRNSGKKVNGAAEKHYQCMTQKQLCALPVHQLSDDVCVLLLWTTWPFMKDAIALAEAWGFQYVNCFLDWVKLTSTGKLHFGLGYRTRGNTEPLLFCVKGQDQKLKNSSSVSQVMIAPIEQREHSKKPEVTFDLIEKYFKPHLKRIELFARKTRPGWDVWGNETTKYNN